MTLTTKTFGIPTEDKEIEATGEIMTRKVTMAADSIFSHNGVLTVVSTKTGDHRTFKISTWMEKNEEGKSVPKMGRDGLPTRTVGLLTGPDNTSDFTNFGFVDGSKDRIWVFGKKKGGQFEALAKMLENLQRLEENGKVKVEFATKCRRCNRALTTPESVRTGIGPICEDKELAGE